MVKETIPENISKIIDKIRYDNTSGSVELVKESADLILSLVNNNGSIDQIKNCAILLQKAQPTMASILNFANNLMIIIDHYANTQPKENINNYCKKFLQELKMADELISKQVVKYIKDKATIITHSYSSTVLNALLYAKNTGKEFSVICTESRPKNEGRKLAEKLGNANIPVNIIVDANVFSFIPDADIILVGCDAVAKSGMINKIGTKGIAMVAHYYKKPMFALCSIIKFLPDNYPIPIQNQKDPYEVYPQKNRNVKPINYYFDLTPLEFLTGIITEKALRKHKFNDRR
jgi:translation initiation factor 2B subunit (eIF-2B alpha/beta/delta family)